MKIVTKEFLNENAYLSYPIDGRATYEPYSKEDASAIHSLLLDLQLTVPKEVANTAFVASIKVSSALVSLVIMGSKETPFYENTLPEPTYSSPEYDTFNAVILATAIVSRSQALTQTPVTLVGEIDGVGGWVVFGPGVENVGNWSFSGPASSAISSKAITLYEYGGVKTVGKFGFEKTLNGAINFVGQNGIEVVNEESNVISIRFSGPSVEVQNDLSQYAGECGIRPETNTCSSTPIKTINRIKPFKNPSDSKNELVLILNAPLYARAVFDPGIDGPVGVEVSSDQPLESLCSPRLRIPDTECEETNPVLPATKAIVVAPKTELVLEYASMGLYETVDFIMHQQHPNRPSVSVFKPKNNNNMIVGEIPLELHVDVSARQWQVYSVGGPSLKLFGSLDGGIVGYRNIELNGIPARLTIGQKNILDKLGMNSIIVKSDSLEAVPWEGTYSKVYHNNYVHENDSQYSFKLANIGNSWGIYKNKTLVIGGSFDSSAVSFQLQTYKNAIGNSETRAVTVRGVAL